MGFFRSEISKSKSTETFSKKSTNFVKNYYVNKCSHYFKRKFSKICAAFN